LVPQGKAWHRDALETRAHRLDHADMDRAESIEPASGGDIAMIDADFPERAGGLVYEEIPVAKKADGAISLHPFPRDEGREHGLAAAGRALDQQARPALDHAALEVFLDLAQLLARRLDQFLLVVAEGDRQITRPRNGCPQVGHTSGSSSGRISSPRPCSDAHVIRRILWIAARRPRLTARVITGGVTSQMRASSALPPTIAARLSTLFIV